MDKTNLTSSNRKFHYDDDLQVVKRLTPNGPNDTLQTITEAEASSQTARTIVQPGAQHVAAADAHFNIEKVAPTFTQQKMYIKNSTETKTTAPQLAAAVDPNSDMAEPLKSSSSVTPESPSGNVNEQGMIPPGNAGVQNGSDNINRLHSNLIPDTSCRLSSIQPGVKYGQLDSDQTSDKDKDVIIAETVSHKLIFGIPRKFFIMVTLVVLLALNVTVILAFSRKNSSEATSPYSSTTSPPTAASDTTPVLQSIKDRGFIRCRASSIDVQNNRGFTLDLCSAIAAAIFGDPRGAKYRTEFTPFGDQFAALWDRSIDVSTSLTTHNMVRDVYEPSTGLGIAFSTPYFYSGLTFVGVPTYVNCADRYDTLIGLCRGLSVCVRAGTTTSELVERLIPGLSKHEQDDFDALFSAFANGTCNVIASDPLALSEDNVRKVGYKGEYTLSRKLHSNEPLAITSKGDDQEWASFCDWVLQALIKAERLNITKEMALDTWSWNLATYTLEDEFADTSIFGFDHKGMFRHAIAAVGNYGEMYERHYESIVPRGVEGINTFNGGDTGLMYYYPFGDLMVGISPSSTLLPPGPSEGGTLESIANRGVLRCGVLGNRTGFSSLQDVDDSSEEKAEATRQTIKMWSGLDIEYCRAIAAAIFPHVLSNGSKNNDGVVFVEVGTVEEDGYVALDEDRIDVFAGGSFRLTTNVKEATTGKGFTFTPPYFYYDSDSERNRFGIEMKGVGRSLVTRDNDPQWSTFVRWILNAIIYAEQTGISKANASDMPGVEVFGPNYFQMFRDVILAVGNYGEIFIRTLEEPYNITRVGRNLANMEGTPQMLSSSFS